MKIIPKQKRIKVYKRALEIVENQEKGFDHGLCILLRNLYYKGESAHIQKFVLTPERFPEFGKYYGFINRDMWKDRIKFNELYEKNDNLWRRIVLRLILEELGENEEI